MCSNNESSVVYDIYHFRQITSTLSTLNSMVQNISIVSNRFHLYNLLYKNKVSIHLIIKIIFKNPSHRGKQLIFTQVNAITLENVRY